MSKLYQVLTIIVILAFVPLVMWAAKHGHQTETSRVVSAPKTLTTQERIAAVIDECRHELQADGLCLAYDAMRQSNPTQAAELADRNPILRVYARRIAQIENGN